MTPSTLVLVRHAAAAAGPADRDRPLTAEGERQAGDIGAWLARRGVLPDLALVSPARRTLQTWDRLRAELPSAPDGVVDERIYDNTVDGLLELLREADHDVRSVVLVGHNPAVAHVAGVLDDGAGSEPARTRLAAGFPPASVALFEVGTPFADLAPGGATLVDVGPRDG
jgi:phosphohistidine phosphatase